MQSVFLPLSRITCWGYGALSLSYILFWSRESQWVAQTASIDWITWHEFNFGVKDQIQILRLHLTLCKFPDWKIPKVAAINCSCPGPWRGFTSFVCSQLFLKIRHCWYAANFVCAPPNPGSGSACSKYSSSQYLLRVRWGWSFVSWLWYSAVRKGWQLNKIYWFSLLKYLYREAATLLTTHQCGVMLLKELNAC